MEHSDFTVSEQWGKLHHNRYRSKLTSECIKVITPFNDQVNALSQVLPQITIGTID